MRIGNTGIHNYNMNQASNNKEIKGLLEEHYSELEQIKMQFENCAEETKNAQKGAKILITCLKISRRIISGHIVPAKDHEYLKKHDPALYSKSILMRIPKENPKKYKRLSKDDDEQNSFQEDTLSNHASLNGPFSNRAGDIQISKATIDIKI